MEIIPAIDIIGGKCVRLRKGDYDQMTPYSEDPFAVAKEFASAGIRRIHIVDLDGAKADRIMNLPILHAIAYNADLIVDFGGGVKSKDQVELALEAGADMVTGGSVAAKDRDEYVSWLEEFGPEKIILGADVLNGKVMTDGWQNESKYEIHEFLEFYQEKGVESVICTDVSKDGTLEGPAFDLYKDLMKSFPSIKFVASGGVSSYDDLLRLQDLDIYGAIVGKAYYEGKISLDQLAELC